MSIEMIGIDHSTAGIDIRSLFSFTKRQTAEILARMMDVTDLNGCVIINTCNRMELWASTAEGWSGDLYDQMCAIRQVPADRYRPYVVTRREREAVRHLFRLASGLESRILGEDQILTQVGDALAFSRECYAADHVLETLFRRAVTAAKKVKTHISLSSSDQSVVHSMIRDLKEAGMTFSGKNALVIGNGAMGKLAAVRLLEEGADVTMTVRQFHSGVVDIPTGCRRIDYDSREEVLPDCDYVVSATVSPNCTLPRAMVECTMQHPMVLIDLAVPRDIDPSVKDLDGIFLFDVDSFREGVHSKPQIQAIREADKLLEEQMEEFFVWYDCMDVIPLIQQLKADIADDLSPRLEKKLHDLPLDSAGRQALDEDIRAAAERTANKMLFGLRDGLDPDTLRECLRCLDDLYRAGDRSEE